MGFLFNLFLNPIFLAATATAGVPVVIHLIHRRQAPTILFSTLRFLRISAERTSRRQRIQDLLLLILRALLFFLLAFALAKPFIRGGGVLGGTASTSIAIVLDNSASMGIVERRPRFRRAKEIARSLISSGNLRSNRDACCLIFTNLTGQREIDIEPALERQLGNVENRINVADLSAGFADLASAVEQAVEVLAKSDDPNRELYVITDMQGSSWQGLDADSALAGHADIPLIVIDSGSSDYENLTAVDCRIGGQGEVVEIPVTIRATIFNGSQKTVSRYVSLYINRAKVDNTDQPVAVPPNGTSEVAFTHTFHAAGQYAGWVRIDNDSLDVDNQRNFAIGIADRLPVLLVKDEAAPVSYQDEAYFVAAALNPFSLVDPGAKWALDPRTEVPQRLTAEVLRPFPVVFLLNCRGVTPAVAALLADYVRQGGGLVISAGDNVSAEAYNRALGTVEGVEGGLLPATLQSPVGDATERERARRPDHAEVTHFLLKPFADYPSLYQRLLIYRYLRVERPLPRSTATLMALDGGDPLVLESAGGRLGEGRVVLITTTLTNAWTNMPASNFYAPFVQRLVFHLARRTASQRRSVTAGTPVRIPFPGVTEPATLDVIMPNDETVQVKTSTSQAGHQEAVFGLTFGPGVYTYRSIQHPHVRGAFAVNPDPAEANLARIDWADLRPKIPLRNAYYAADADAMRERIVAMRKGVQVWNLFLFAVLMLAVLECFVANRVKPTESPDSHPG